MQQKLDLSTHSLNSSASKQKYSFSKKSRFESPKKPLCDRYYDIPSMRNLRSTSLGYGEKDIGLSNNNSPPPGSYRAKSQFDQEKSGYYFGVDRQKLYFGHPLASVKQKSKLPGPGTYNYDDSVAKRLAAITLKSRIQDNSNTIRYKNNPGPGSYHLEQMGKVNYYITSNHQDKTHCRFPPISKQLKPLSNKRTSLSPGQYNPFQSCMKPDGRYILSNNESSRSQRFGKSQRQSLVIKSIQKNPGPGAYQSFSIFN